MTLKLLTLAPLVFLLLAITTIRMQNPPEDEAVITVPLVCPDCQLPMQWAFTENGRKWFGCRAQIIRRDEMEYQTQLAHYEAKKSLNPDSQRPPFRRPIPKFDPASLDSLSRTQFICDAAIPPPSVPPQAALVVAPIPPPVVLPVITPVVVAAPPAAASPTPFARTPAAFPAVCPSFALLGNPDTPELVCPPRQSRNYPIPADTSEFLLWDGALAANGIAHWMLGAKEFHELKDTSVYAGRAETPTGPTRTFEGINCNAPSRVAVQNEGYYRVALFDKDGRPFETINMTRQSTGFPQGGTFLDVYRFHFANAGRISMSVYAWSPEHRVFLESPLAEDFFRRRGSCLNMKMTPAVASQAFEDVMELNQIYRDRYQVERHGDGVLVLISITPIVAKGTTNQHAKEIISVSHELPHLYASHQSANPGRSGYGSRKLSSTESGSTTILHLASQEANTLLDLEEQQRLRHLLDGEMIDPDLAGFNRGKNAREKVDNPQKQHWVEKMKALHIADRTVSTTSSLQSLANTLPPVVRQPPFQFGQITTDRNAASFDFRSFVRDAALAPMDEDEGETGGDDEIEVGKVSSGSQSGKGKGRAVEMSDAESASVAMISSKAAGKRKAVEDAEAIELEDYETSDLQRQLEELFEEGEEE